MMVKQFCFVESAPVGKSKTELELDQAKARSHAATISHQRRKDEHRERSQLAAATQGRHWTEEHEFWKARLSLENKRAQQQHSTKVRSNLRKLLPFEKKLAASDGELISGFDSTTAISYYSPSPVAHDIEDKASSLIKKNTGEQTDLPASSIMTDDPLSSSRLHEQLDPFFKPAVAISLRDRNLLHQCKTIHIPLILSLNTSDLLATPVAVYGIPSTALYCPIRETVMGVQTNSIYLHWVLLLKEISTLAPQASDQSLTVFARRAYLYKTMNKMISDKRTRVSDDTIIGLTFAGVAEARNGELLKAQKHLVASRLLIDDGGGPDQISVTTCISTGSAMIFFGLGVGAFQNFRVLTISIKAFTQAMMNIQSANQQFRRETRKILLRDGNFTKDLHRYIANRRRAFDPVSALRPFMEAEFHDKARSQQRSHVAILWLMNRALWEFRGSYKDSANFLQHLLSNVEYDNDTAAGARPTMKAWGLLYIVANIAATLTARPSWPAIKEGATAKKNGILGSWELLDLVELLELLPEDKKARVVGLLSTWLIGGSEEEEHTTTEKELDEIGNLMKVKWLGSKSAA